MCTRERYRIESRTYMQAHNTDKPKFWFVDGRAGIEDYIALPLAYKVERIRCGDCLQCRLENAKEKAARCIKEAKYWEHNTMITLTFDDEHVPRSTGIDPDTGEVYESLTLGDHEEYIGKFMKRLRRKFGNGVRFFGCGEYGSNEEYIDRLGNVRVGTERPHYHIILFNCKFDDAVFHKWSRCEWKPNMKNALYKSKTLDKLWKMGHADINEVTYETCRYVAGYVVKKHKGKDSDEHYMLKGQKPPYTFGSRRPGIGYQYFVDNEDKFWAEQPIWTATKKGLIQVKSRYYDKLLEKKDPERFRQLKDARSERNRNQYVNLLEKTDIDQHTYIENSESKFEMKNRLMKRRG